jgi:hypothetical protein
MTLLDEVETDAEREPCPAPSRSWLMIVVLVACGLLILAHLGCHGDEDTELFGRLAPIPLVGED